MAAKKPAELMSMTGFGRGSAENRHAAAKVELRTVNGKGLSIKLRLPSDRLELENRIEAALRKGLERGSVQGKVNLRVLHGDAVELDLDTLKRYLQSWRKAEKQLGLREVDPSLAELLAMPGAYSNSEESPTVTRAVERAAMEAAKQALEALLDSRRREGQRLGRELKRLVKGLESQLAKVRRRIPKAQAELAKRYAERVQQAMAKRGDGDPVDFARELVLLGERADVQEEVARLQMHAERLHEMLDGGGAIGRELEFMVQECHREVTTLGNKSSDEVLSASVVAMKLVVQQLKEQLANVE